MGIDEIIKQNETITIYIFFVNVYIKNEKKLKKLLKACQY